MRDDGVIIVGTRAEAWMEMSYNKREVMLLPFAHPISKLYTRFIHNINHSGIASTVSKVRRKFWILKLQIIAKSIIHHCTTCKKERKIRYEQIMSSLPVERLKPVPAWLHTSLDYFGPFEIHGEVNKRARGKAYGLIFNCMQTRAVHIELCPDYSADKFLSAFRRFIAIRGFPKILFSDKGSQLESANKEMKLILKDLDWKTIEEYGAAEGLQWNFTPGHSPWKNGCSEALIKSVKKCIRHAIGQQVLMFSELLTVVSVFANLLNERPIGAHPRHPDVGHYLCPNNLLLGRCTSLIPSGPYQESCNLKKRFYFIQSLVN